MGKTRRPLSETKKRSKHSQARHLYWKRRKLECDDLNTITVNLEDAVVQHIVNEDNISSTAVNEDDIGEEPSSSSSNLQQEDNVNNR
jgi:hypothetical protein